MRWIGRTLRSSALALAITAALGAPAARAVDWLVLLVDRSNSIDGRELLLQRSAYVRLLSDPEVIRALGGAKVAIVEFDTRPEIVVEWTDAASAAATYGDKQPLALRGQTGIGHAITTALTLLVGKSGHMVIDVSGDGRENVDSDTLARARAAAAERAIEINGLAILNDDIPNLDAYYSREVVTGFVLPVEGRDDFYRALKRKLFFEVAQRAPKNVIVAR
jgi:hypothetical protein